MWRWLWEEIRNLRYLRVQGHWSFRNYYFGEASPFLRRWKVTRWLIEDRRRK